MLHWIVRETTFPSRTAPLTEELHRQGYPVHVVTSHDRGLDHLYSQLTDYLPPEVITFVESLNIEWEPDPIYVVDVCHAEGHLHVMELNPFSCSDYYRCPVEPIVSWANAIAHQRLA